MESMREKERDCENVFGGKIDDKPEEVQPRHPEEGKDEIYDTHEQDPREHQCYEDVGQESTDRERSEMIERDGKASEGCPEGDRDEWDEKSRDPICKEPSLDPLMEEENPKRCAE